MDRKILENYLAQSYIPGGTNRNWDSYGHKIFPLTDLQRNLLCDPQTSGGLLLAVEDAHTADFIRQAKLEDLELLPIGEMVLRKDKLIEVV